MKAGLTISLLLSMWLPAHAEMLTGTDETAKLPFWEWRSDAMTLRLVQRLPDQTRAYFAGRGFKPPDVEYIAGFCIFQTVYTNISTAETPHVILHDVRDWRIHYEGKSRSIKPREDWAQQWQQRKVAQPQIIAYEWSLLPSKQVFQAGDYNWGMSVFPVPHGASFDLDIVWQVDGKKRMATLKGLQCAKDIYIEPK